MARSRQRKYGGGKFKSEAQRRAIWANSPTIGHLWAHNMSASGHRRDWAKVRRGAATHSGNPLNRRSSGRSITSIRRHPRNRAR